MKKYTVSEYAKLVGLTREAIHYQIKQKKIKSRKEKGKIFIIMEEESDKKTTDTKDLEYKILLLEQELNLKNQMLDIKENLINSQQETIQAEQRTNISLIKMNENMERQNQVLQLENNSKEEIIKEDTQDKLIPLNQFLEYASYDKKLKTRIRNRFKARWKKEERIIKEDGFFYLDMNSYSYKDLINTVSFT